MSAQTSAILGHVCDVPLPAIQPKYKGISARRKAETEQAINSAFEAQDTEGLRWAIYQHLASNSQLAEMVSNEVLRKLPWHPVANPLTPISGKTPCSHVVNYLAAKRYKDIQQKDVWSRGGDVALDAYNREPLLYNRAEDEPAEHTLDDPKVAQFLETLSEGERELAEECLNKGSQAKGFMAIVHKAEQWLADTEEPSSGAVCECYSCAKRPWSALNALQAVDKLGVMAATHGLFRGLPTRVAHPKGWQLERIHTPQFTDKWKGRWTKPKSTSDDMEPIPSRIYDQVMGMGSLQ